MQAKAVPIVCVFLAALAMSAVAQENTQPAAAPPAQGPGYSEPWHRGQGRGGDPVKRRLNMMDRQLGLTDAQKTQITPILQNRFQQAKTIRNDASLTPEQKQAKLQQLHQTTQSQIQSLLTPEQVQKMKQAGSPEQRVELLSRKLNVTDDQKARLNPIFQRQQQQMQSLRQDTSLSQQQKRDKMKQIRQETHKQVLAVLTPEQQQQLRSSFPGPRGRHGHGSWPKAGPQGSGDQNSGQSAGPGL